MVAAAPSGGGSAAEKRGKLLPVLIGVGLLVAAAIGLLAGKKLYQSSGPSAPLYHEITFRRGAILSARFAPDGQTIYYSAAWQGNPVETFSARQGMVESRSLGLPKSELMAISAKGEMALAAGRASGGNVGECGHAGAGADRGRSTASGAGECGVGRLGAGQHQPGGYP